MRTSKKPKKHVEPILRTGEVFEVAVEYLSPGFSRIVIHFLIADCGATVDEAYEMAEAQYGTASMRSFFGGPDCMDAVILATKRMK